MSELTQKQVDQIKLWIPDKFRLSGIMLPIASVRSLLDAAETILALSWINNLYCPDCSRWNECDCDEDRQACAFWATMNRTELLALYRSRED